MSQDSPRSVRANVAASVLSQGVTRALGLVAIVLVTRSLPVEEFGRYTVAVALAALLAPIADFGTDMHVTREVARDPERAPSHLGASLSSKLLFGALFVAITWCAAVVLGYAPEVATMSALAAAALAATAVGSSYVAVLRGLQRMDREALGAVGARCALVAATVAAVLMGAGAPGILGAQAAGAVAGIALVAAAAAGTVRRAAFAGAARRWPALLKGGVPFALTAVLVTVYFRIDVLMLSRMRDAHSTGLYGACAQLLFAALVASQTLVTAVFPVVAAAGTLKHARVEAVVRRAAAISLAASVPLPIAAALYGGSILEALYGPAYRPAAPALVVLWSTAPVLFATNLLGHLLGALGRQRLVLAVAVSNAALNVVLNLWLIPRWDFTGAAIATLVTEIAGLCLFVAAVRRDLAGLIPWGHVWRIAAAGAAAALVLTLARGAAWPVLPALAAGAATYVAAVIAGGIIRRDDVSMLLPFRAT